MGVCAVPINEVISDVAIEGLVLEYPKDYRTKGRGHRKMCF